MDVGRRRGTYLGTVHNHRDQLLGLVLTCHFCSSLARVIAWEAVVALVELRVRGGFVRTGASECIVRHFQSLSSRELEIGEVVPFAGCR